MDWLTFRAVRSFHQYFTQRWVRMHVTRDLMRSQFHQMRQCKFGEQLGHFWADHMRTQDLAIFFIYNNLYPASVISKPKCLAICLEGKAPHFDVIATFLRLCRSEERRVGKAVESRW